MAHFGNVTTKLFPARASHLAALRNRPKLLCLFIQEPSSSQYRGPHDDRTSSAMGLLLYLRPSFLCLRLDHFGVNFGTHHPILFKVMLVCDGEGNDVALS